ncbi:MAG: GNAT family N-acetyltransferase [Proteobacteria bacterium]|nr:GNAT family N-acetyltransferase [Pseudomonadota bacterium]
MSAADVAIRPLAMGELPAYKALRDAVLAAFPEAFTSDAEAERARPAESYAGRVGGILAPGRHITLAAWDDTTLVGAISCEREARAKARHIGHLVGMMVDAGHQGRGIGRALLAACIAVARRTPDVELLTLSVTAGNASATALYERAGFVRYGSLPRAIRVGDRYHAKDLMALALRP